MEPDALPVKRGRGRPRKHPLPETSVATAGATDTPEGLEIRQDLSPSQQGRIASRLSFPATTEGRIDVGSLRSDTRERLKALLTDEALRAAVVGEPEKPVEIFKPSEVGFLWDLIGQLEAAIAARVMKKVPAEIIGRVFPYSTGEKELLAEPTAAVVNKWCPVVIAKWKEELSLVGLLVLLHKTKLDTCQQLAEDHRRRQRDNENAVAAAAQAALDRLEPHQKVNGGEVTAPADPI